MIETLIICDCATYPPTPCTLAGLKTINYLFGANASGKTTISRVIASVASYPKCSITWQPITPLDCLVYNSNFRDRNFKETGPLKGVFTLGEQNKQLLEEIEEKQKRITEKFAEIEKLKRTLDGDEMLQGKRRELTTLRATFAETCWAQKVKHEQSFKSAFHGWMGSKESFRDKIINERKSNTAATITLAELTSRAATVFAATPSKESTLASPVYSNLEGCETNAILTKVVVGSADVSIAALIEKLKNGDWVNAGQEYLPNAEGKCPFCQQPLPESLETQLSIFFDQAYADDCKTIGDLVEAYERDGETLKNAIKVLIDGGSARLDIAQLRSLAEAIGAIVAENVEHLKRKRREPSSKVELKPIGPACITVTTMIHTANKAIAEHNSRVNNLPTETKNLAAQLWRYLLDVELKTALADFTAKKTRFDGAINGLSSKIASAESEKRTLTNELQALERQTTSVKPTMDAINMLLASFGFTTFKLAESATDGMYELQRANGTPVQDSLSDGEKTFLTFLYFYHLINGSDNATGTANRRVVVFDDPISSLDSDVLFVVSSLVKNVFALARDAASHIAQAFVLTHNIYFHKEITFDGKRSAGTPLADESFWIVRRRGDHSDIERCATNPIKSSYELLWAEVRSPNPSPNSICNAMRRILENYFKLLGGQDLHKLYEKFEGEEKTICRSLVSWINDGSHFAMEELHLSQTSTSVQKYLDVFRKVFETQNHEAHYRMMMGDAYFERAAKVGL